MMDDTPSYVSVIDLQHQLDNTCKNGVTIGDGVIDRIANAHVDKRADIEQIKIILDQNNIKVNDLLVLEEA